MRTGHPVVIAGPPSEARDGSVGSRAGHAASADAALRCPACRTPAPVDAAKGPSEIVAAGGNCQVVVAIDMVESTSTVARLGDTEGSELLERQHRLVRLTASTFGGVELNTTGDGSVLCFASLTRALGFALALRETIDAHNVYYEREPIRIRTGVHAGELVETGDEPQGLVLHKAARIMACAGSGEVLVSDVVYQLAEGKRFAFAVRPPVSLKGFAEPVRVHELRGYAEGDAAARAGTTSAAEPPAAPSAAGPPARNASGRALPARTVIEPPVLLTPSSSGALCGLGCRCVSHALAVLTAALDLLVPGASVTRGRTEIGGPVVASSSDLLSGLLRKAERRGARTR